MRFLGLVCLLLVVASGCKKEEDPRPPRIGECQGDNCGSSPGVGGGGYVPPVSTGAPAMPDAMAADGMAPPSGQEDAGSVMLGTLTGDVRMLVGTDLATSLPIESDVEISALGTGGARVTTEYDGNADFSLSDVQINGNLWVAVEPVGEPERSLIRTLQAVDSTRRERLHLAVVERDSLDEIAEEGAILTPVTLDESKGHVVVYFVDPNEVPVSEVRILPSTAVDGAVIAYDSGNTYSDSVETTSGHGSALLLNLDADTFPGSVTTIEFEHDNVESSFVIDVARDTVTLVVIQLI